MATSIKAVWHSGKPYIRITIDRRSAYVSLSVNYQVEEKDWLAAKCKVSSKNSYADIINRDITTIITELNNYKIDLDIKKEKCTAVSLKLYYERIKSGNEGETDGTSLLEFSNKYVLYPIKKSRTSVATYESKRSIIVNFLASMKKEDVFIEQITTSTLELFQAHMEIKPLSAQTQLNYHIDIRKTLKIAIKKGIIKSNPYDMFDLPIIPKNTIHKKTALTALEIDAIIALDLSSNPKHEVVRDAFIFCYYALGMRASDMMLLTRNNIMTVKGKTIIAYTTKKTGDNINILVVGYLDTLVKKYMKRGSDSTYMFPFLDGFSIEDLEGTYRRMKCVLTHIDRVIKILARDAGIERYKQVSSHVARRSAAQCLSDKGMQLDQISRVFGHSDSMITETHYVTQDDVQVMEQAAILLAKTELKQ